MIKTENHAYSHVNREKRKCCAYLLRKALGAKILERIDDPDGKLMIAILSINGANFFVSEEVLENQNLSPESLSGNTTVRLELEVADPDSFAKNAIAGGAKEMFPVQDREYGRRDGRIVDPFGHQWVMGRGLE